MQIQTMRLQYTVMAFIISFCLQVNFLHWEDGEPDNKNNVESCVQFNTYGWDRSGSWKDVQCEKYIGWICQIRAGKAYSSH